MNSSWDSWETEVSHSEWASQTHRSPSSQSWSYSHPAPPVHSPQPTGGSKAMRNFLSALEYLMLPYKRSMDSWRAGIKCPRRWWPQFTGISHLNELEWVPMREVVDFPSLSVQSFPGSKKLLEFLCSSWQDSVLFLFLLCACVNASPNASWPLPSPCPTHLVGLTPLYFLQT